MGEDVWRIQWEAHLRCQGTKAAQGTKMAVNMSHAVILTSGLAAELMPKTSCGSCSSRKCERSKKPKTPHYIHSTMRYYYCYNFSALVFMSMQHLQKVATKGMKPNNHSSAIPNGKLVGSTAIFQADTWNIHDHPKRLCILMYFVHTHFWMFWCIENLFGIKKHHGHSPHFCVLLLLVLLLLASPPWQPWHLPIGHPLRSFIVSADVRQLGGGQTHQGAFFGRRCNGCSVVKS